MSEQHTNSILHVTSHPGDAGVPNGCSIGIDDDFGASGGRDYFLFTAVHGDPDELKANARRMVACWNACMGASVDWLEGRASAMTPRTVPIDAQLDAAIAQRDELLAALGELVPHVLHYAGMPGAHQDATRDAARARAAIAKIAGAKT